MLAARQRWPRRIETARTLAPAILGVCALFAAPMSLASADLDSADLAATELVEATPGSELDSTLNVDPLALTPEMKLFLEEKVPSRQSRRTRLSRLQHAIFDAEDGLGITYGSATTSTAAGTFESRSGNCLSFTLLFVSLARQLGLETHFVEVDEVTGWSQRGELGFSHWHMYAEVEIDGSPVPVDFLPWTERRYRSSRRISEVRVRSHFHNNLGAGLVAAGDPRAALPHFRLAIALDPSFNPARVNMAVALRREGRRVEAEKLLLGVLETESGNAVAAANLASLYEEEGRHGDAAKWLAKRDVFLKRNPFHHFRLGLRAYQSGDFSQARDHFKSAISRQPDEAAFFEQLAETHLKLGEPRKARADLRRALRLTENENHRQALELRLRGENSGRPESS